MLTLIDIIKSNSSKQLINLIFSGLFILLLVQQGHAATSSSSIIYAAQSNKIYTANFDGRSITWANSKDPKQKREASIGKDIRRLALNYDETQLLASDYLNGDFIWLNAKTLKEEYRVSTSGRPFGIVYDHKNKL